MLEQAAMQQATNPVTHRETIAFIPDSMFLEVCGMARQSI
jgi:hypothetical protein